MKKVRMSDLTPKEQQAVQVFFTTGSQVEAYRAAYDCKRMKPETIHKRAGELFRREKVWAVVEAERARLRKEFALGREQFLQQLAAIAFACFDDVAYMEDEQLIFKDTTVLPDHVRKAVKRIRMDPNGGHKSIEMHDKIAAMRLMAQILGLLDNKQQPEQPPLVVHMDFRSPQERGEAVEPTPAGTGGTSPPRMPSTN
ncbi:MAG: terminase small subunit [Candidatus Hydrogenedentota bacterium]